jgi:hypothetical protein
MKHYHMWVTDKSLVPNATQYFAGNGFNDVTFVAFGDRNKYTSLYDKKAPLCIEDLVNNKLFESMELDPNAGKNFHPGVFSPMKKRMHGYGHRRRKQITTRPIFSCDRDNAASAGMVASGEGGRMGCSLEERGKVTDEARTDIEADEMVALGVSHVPRSTVEVGGKKRRLNNSPPVETPTPSQSLLFSSSSLSTLSSSLPPPTPPPMLSTSTQLDPIEVCFDNSHSNDNGAAVGGAAAASCVGETEATIKFRQDKNWRKFCLGKGNTCTKFGRQNGLCKACTRSEMAMETA